MEIDDIQEIKLKHRDSMVRTVEGKWVWKSNGTEVPQHLSSEAERLAFDVLRDTGKSHLVGIVGDKCPNCNDFMTCFGSGKCGGLGTGRDREQMVRLDIETSGKEPLDLGEELVSVSKSCAEMKEALESGYFQDVRAGSEQESLILDILNGKLKWFNLGDA